jgi:hypothetical protein
LIAATELTFITQGGAVTFIGVTTFFGVEGVELFTAVVVFALLLDAQTTTDPPTIDEPIFMEPEVLLDVQAPCAGQTGSHWKQINVRTSRTFFTRKK